MPVIARLALLAIIAMSQAFAGNTITTWTGSGGDGLWSTSGNWTFGVPGQTPGITTAVIGNGVTVTLDDATSLDPNSLTEIDLGAGSTLIIPATFDLTATRIVLAQGAVIQLQGGALNNIDVQALSTATVIASNPGTNLNALTGVTIEAGVTLDLSQGDGASCTVIGTLTVNGLVQIGSADGTASGSLFCSNNVTLGGTGSITFGASPLNAITEISSGATLTIGTGIGGQSLTINGINGVITSVGPAEGLNLLVNGNGLIASDSGGAITVNVGSWEMEGLLWAVNQGGSSLIVNASGPGVIGASNPNAQVLADQGTVAIGGTGSWQYFVDLGITAQNGGTLTFGGAWSSGSNQNGSGSLVLESGSTANLGGTFSATDADSIWSASGVPDTINIIGAMANPSTFYLTRFSDAQFNLTNRQWNLKGGSIAGGTISSQIAGAATLYGTDFGGALDGVTIDSNVIVSLSLPLNGGIPALTVADGITINGELQVGTPSGQTPNGMAGIVTAADSQTFGGSGSLVFGDNAQNSIQNAPGTSVALTFGPSLHVQGNNGTVTVGYLYNEAAIASQGNASLGERLTLDGQFSWINLGTITAAQGSSLVLASAFGSGSNTSGMVANGASASLMDGMITTAGGSLSVSAASGWTNTVSTFAQGSSVPNSGAGIQVLGGEGPLGSLTFWNMTDATSPAGTGISLSSSVLTVGENDSPTHGSTTTVDQIQAIIANSTALSAITLVGTIDNLAADNPNTNGTLAITSTAPTWTLSAGTIAGGTIQGSNGGGTLFLTPTPGAPPNQFTGGVTIANGIVIDLALNTSQGTVACNVTGGLTIDGQIMIGGQGIGALQWSGTQTWGGSGLIVLNGANASNSLITDISTGEGQQLTFGDASGSASALKITSGSGTIALANSDTLLIAEFSVISDFLGSTIAFTAPSSGATLINQGVLATSSGVMTFSNLGVINQNNDVENPTGSGVISCSASGGAMTFTNLSLDNRSGSRLEASQAIIALNGVALTNEGAVDAIGGLATGAQPCITGASGSWNNSGTISAGSDSIANAIAVTVSDLTNSGTINVSAGSSIAVTTVTWSNAGSITTAAATDSFAISATGAGMLTGQFTNHGSLTIAGGNWVNATNSDTGPGIVAMPNSSVYLGGAWSNAAGSSMQDTAAAFYLGGSFVVDEFNAIALTSISPDDCSFSIIGAMNGNPGSNPMTQGILDLSYGNYNAPAHPPSWQLDGGTLLAVTLTDTSGSGMALAVSPFNPPAALASPVPQNPSTLNQVTVGQSGNDTVLLDLAQANLATCVVSGGLTVNSAIQVGSPVIGEGSTTGYLMWSGTQTWSGGGRIDFGFSPENAIKDGNGSAVGQILTVAAGLTIDGGSGTIQATSAGAQLIDNGNITSLAGRAGGALSSPVAGILAIDLGGDNAMTIGNGGTLQVAPATSIELKGDLTLDGTLAVAIGTPNSPPAQPASATVNALTVSGATAISNGILQLTAVAGYPPAGGATNALFTVLTSLGQVSGAFTSLSGAFGAPDYQAVTDAAQQVVSVQLTQPSVGIALNGPGSTNQSPLSFQISSDEALYFPAGGPAVTGGAITGTYPTTIAAASASFTVQVIPSGTGTVTLSIPAGAAVDAQGTPAIVLNASSAYFDNTPIFATITPNGTSTNNGTILYTLNFSKPLASLATGSITATGGTISAFNPGASQSLWFATVTAAGSGSPATAVTLNVPAAAATDLAGNHLAASATATVAYDTVAPTVIISPSGTATNAATIPFTLSFSKPVALTAAGLSAVNGTLGALSGGPVQWTVPVTVASPGTVTLTVLAPPAQNVAVDLAGNPLAAAVSASVVSDAVPPALVSFTPSGISTNASPIPFTITFTKPVSLDPSGVAVTNGALTALSAGPAASYTLEVTPSAGTPPIAVTVAVAGTAATDAAGNAMAAPASTTVDFDNRLLTAAITPSGATVSANPIVFTVTFSAPLASPLTAGSLVVTNGAASSVTAVSSTVYSVPIVPTASGGVFLEVPYAAVSDGAGNPNQSAIAAVTYNSGNPSVVVTPASGQVAVAPVIFTLTFSAPVTGLTTAGLQSNGSIGALSGSGAVYTVPVTPSGFGAVTMEVLAGAALDANSLPSTASNLASVTYAVVTAATPVTVTVVPPAATANQSPLLFTLSFSVPVSGLTIGDLVVTNGTASNLVGSGAVYTVDITPAGDGPVSVAVEPDVATDSAGTGNLGSPPATVVYHATPPSATLAFGASVPVTAASFPLSISFSEPVTGFTVGALAIANGTASAFTAIDDANYSVTITPQTPVNASVIATIPAGACQDAYGNASLAATVTIPMQSGAVSTGVVTPAIALSPATSTVFTAICPGTLGGLAQVRSFLAGASSAQARAFVWDATLQDFVGVPAQAPTGGWQPFQGIFLASRLPTDFDFNGFMTTFDFTLTLQPGWNFVGIPPLDDNGSAVTTHQWSDLQLEDTAGNIITGPERVNLIDVGAWAWNGSAYVQVSGALATGQGYWIDNASSPGVNLVLRRLSPSEIAASLSARRPSAAAAGGQASAAAAATIGYKAHGTPPQPPSASGQGDAAGHGCGLGSGIGALILGLTLLLRLRLRSRGKAVQR